MNDADERRRFFRIDDFVHLSLREVSRDEMDQRMERLEQNMAGSFGLMIGLNAIGQQVTASLRRVESRDPDAADCLKALDKKLELLARAFLSEEVDLGDKPARAVNLSAGGMAVNTREPLAEGSLLEIKLLLVPSYTGIFTYGTLVACHRLEGDEQDPEFPYQVRIDFAFMREEDRDALIRHVLLKQAEWLRRRREQRR
jgi:hypothetical protein